MIGACAGSDSKRLAHSAIARFHKDESIHAQDSTHVANVSILVLTLLVSLQHHLMSTSTQNHSWIYTDTFKYTTVPRRVG